MPETAQIATTKSFALTRVNVLVGRVFVISSVFTALETGLNAFGTGQVQTQPISLALFAILTAIEVINLFNFWAFSGAKLWYRFQVAVVLLTTIFWPLIFLGTPEDGSKPWVWWALGMAGIAAFMGFKPWTAAVVILALPTAWFFLRISETGGSSPWQPALQDALYTLLFSSAISSLVALLQTAAKKVDVENQRATLAAAQQARTDAIERERSRVDALVHDKVLTTLLVAANAKTEEDFDASVELATLAIESLSNHDDFADKPTTTLSFFLSLKSAIERQAPEVQIKLDGVNDQAISEGVALALSEAAIQAVTNALQHAGPTATLAVVMKGSGKAVKIVVADTGRGFRMNRVPKNRLGIRLSIIERVESVGGRVFIDSQMGRGTNVVIEWGEK